MLASVPLARAMEACRGRHCEEEAIPEMEVHSDVVEHPTDAEDPHFDALRCTADADGYVGTVHPRDNVVSYDVGLELVESADMGSVFEAVSESIEVMLLKKFFPGLCKKQVSTDGGSNRRQMRFGIAGFRFNTRFVTQGEFAEGRFNHNATIDGLMPLLILLMPWLLFHVSLVRFRC